MSEKKSRRKATVAQIRRVRRPAPKKPRQPTSPSAERVLHPNGLLIGYARVSTLDQNMTLQRDALTAAGCTKLFVEQMSGLVLGAACAARRPRICAGGRYHGCLEA